MHNKSKYRSILEVDLEYLEKLHKMHNDYCYEKCVWLICKFHITDILEKELVQLRKLFDSS